MFYTKFERNRNVKIGAGTSFSSPFVPTSVDNTHSLAIVHNVYDGTNYLNAAIFYAGEEEYTIESISGIGSTSNITVEVYSRDDVYKFKVKNTVYNSDVAIVYPTNSDSSLEGFSLITAFKTQQLLGLTNSVVFLYIRKSDGTYQTLKPSYDVTSVILSTATSITGQAHAYEEVTNLTNNATINDLTHQAQSLNQIANNLERIESSTTSKYISR